MFSLPFSAPDFLNEHDRARFERHAARAYRRAMRHRVEMEAVADMTTAFGRLAEAAKMELDPDVVALVFESEVADRCRR